LHYTITPSSQDTITPIIHQLPDHLPSNTPIFITPKYHQIGLFLVKYQSNMSKYDTNRVKYVGLHVVNMVNTPDQYPWMLYMSSPHLHHTSTYLTHIPITITPPSHNITHIIHQSISHQPNTHIHQHSSHINTPLAINMQHTQHPTHTSLTPNINYTSIPLHTNTSTYHPSTTHQHPQI
jgi:hypothetical protein